MAFCSNCGKFVENTAKFCSNCGSTISLTGITAPVAQQKTEIAPTITQKNKLEERQLFFDGEILKCPHCGEILTSFTSNCPSCGNELRGLKSANSIQDFFHKLEMIEVNREQPTFGSFLRQKLSPKTLNSTDLQKINLIQTFPIPNTKEDIKEFIILSYSNMQSLDKNSYSDQAVYNAWKSKHRQACEKAVFLFEQDELKELKRLGFKNPNGWSSWSTLGKIAWIFLNIYTLGIPALIYSIKRK